MLLSPLRDERMSFTMNNKSFRKLRVFFVFIEFAFNSYLQTNFSLIWIVVGITTCWGLHFYNFRKSYRKVIVKLWTRRHSSSEKKIVIKYILRNKLWIMGSLFKLMTVLILIFCPNWCIIVRCGKIFIHRGDVIPIEWIMLCIKSFFPIVPGRPLDFPSGVRLRMMLKYVELLTHSPNPTEKVKANGYHFRYLWLNFLRNEFSLLSIFQRRCSGSRTSNLYLYLGVVIQKVYPEHLKLICLRFLISWKCC